MNSDTRRIALAYINLRLMAADATAGIEKLVAAEQPASFQTGILLGLTGAKHVLDGRTADEAWDLLKPVVDKIRKGGETA